MARRFGLLSWTAVLVGVIAAILLAAVIVWWGAIREAMMDPGVPYQTYTPPPAPDYANPAAWALLPEEGATGAADVFFVHPTTFDGREWNAPAAEKTADRLLDEVMIPNYAGPFERAGRVFAPRYRQASLYTTLTLREDAREARAFAYRDVKAAFDHYLASHDRGAPLIIAGAGQGAVLAERLAREAAADPALRARLVAVYLMEAAIPSDAHGPDADLPACAAPQQTGCVAAYLTQGPGEDRRTYERLRHAPVWNGAQLVNLAGRPILCFNPLTGASNGGVAAARQNDGAANASGLEWGVRPGFQSHEVGAQCVDGVLEFTRPASPAFRRTLSWTERQRVRPYNLFYANLEADALARVAAMAGP